MKCNTVKENAQALVGAGKEIGLEVNTDKTKYMVMSRDQNGGRSHSVRTDNSSLKRWKNIWELTPYLLHGAESFLRS